MLFIFPENIDASINASAGQIVAWPDWYDVNFIEKKAIKTYDIENIILTTRELLLLFFIERVLMAAFGKFLTLYHGAINMIIELFK